MSPMSVVLILAVIAAICSIAGACWHYRPRFTAPEAEPAFCGHCNLDCDECLCIPPATVYEHTVRDHGDPGLIDLDPPMFAWPA
jgi:hypothetical protein